MSVFGGSNRAASPAAYLLLCSLLAVALAFPTIYIALDHHGAERLPWHTHAASPGEAAQAHLHSFEQPHAHAAGRNMLEEGAEVVLRAKVDAPWLVLLVLFAIALPLAVGPGAASDPGWPLGPAAAPSERVPSRPPTPPPTVLDRVAAS